MIKIIADASLPDLSDFFQPPFLITPFTAGPDLYQQIQEHDVLLCRSTLKIDAALLADTRISCIATVSSGTDHIVATNDPFLAKRNDGIHVDDDVLCVILKMCLIDQSLV